MALFDVWCPCPFQQFLAVSADSSISAVSAVSAVLALSAVLADSAVSR